MRNKILTSVILLFIWFFINQVFAQTDAIIFPIPELGNCNNKTECRAFCDKEENVAICTDFAQKHNLVSKDQADKTRKIVEIKTGPGGCQGRDECQKFCDDSANADVCLQFAQDHGFLGQKEVEQAKKISMAIKEGGPGSCKNKTECQTYCSNPEHSPECLDFAEKAGFIPKEDAERLKKFAILMKSGESTGGCQSKEACEAYCQIQSHQEECFAFAEKAGVAKKGDIEKFKEIKGKGPGDCKGEDECRTFCDNPENQEVCLKFAQDHNLIHGDRIEEVRKGTQQLKEHFQNIPPKIVECINSTIGAEKFQSIRNGEIVPGPELGQALRHCFESNNNDNNGQPYGDTQNSGMQGQGESHNTGAGGIMGGPGGCSSPEECRKYCQEHMDECHQKMMQRPENSNHPMISGQPFTSNRPHEFQQPNQPNTSHMPSEFHDQPMMSGRPMPNPNSMTDEQRQKMEMMKQNEQKPTNNQNHVPFDDHQMTPEQQQMREQYMQQHQQNPQQSFQPQQYPREGEYQQPPSREGMMQYQQPQSGETHQYQQ